MSVVVAEDTSIKANKDVVIHCKEISKTYYEKIKGTRAFNNCFCGQKKVSRVLDNVCLKVYRNEVFGLLGANGSGKSTLLRLWSTLLLPDEGILKILDYDVTKYPLKIRRQISRVSVEASLFKKLSAVENLRYAARLYGFGRLEGEERALKILERLGISADKATIPLENFSRGMQQKVAIARAFIPSPKLILLDEPTTGLDPKSKKDVEQYIEEILQIHDVTIVLATHDMNEAEKLCHRIAIIDQGRIVALGTADELKKLSKEDSLEKAFITLTGKSDAEV